MARIHVTHRCGHQDTILAPVRQREYLHKRAGASLCLECIQEQENLQSAIASWLEGLPALRGGTEKQIGYGETCRRWVIESIRDLLQGEERDDGIMVRLALRDQQSQQTVWELMQAMLTQTYAGWWCQLWQRHQQQRMTGRRLEMITWLMSEMGWCRCGRKSQHEVLEGQRCEGEECQLEAEKARAAILENR